MNNPQDKNNSDFAELKTGYYTTASHSPIDISDLKLEDIENAMRTIRNNIDNQLYQSMFGSLRTSPTIETPREPDLADILKYYPRFNYGMYGIGNVYESPFLARGQAALFGRNAIIGTGPVKQIKHELKFLLSKNTALIMFIVFVLALTLAVAAL